MIEQLVITLVGSLLLFYAKNLINSLDKCVKTNEKTNSLLNNYEERIITLERMSVNSVDILQNIISTSSPECKQLTINQLQHLQAIVNDSITSNNN